jgi:transcriptional regulator GlxA family with amidase domain
MIKGIAVGAGLHSNNNYTSWPVFYNNSSSDTLVGQVRYNGSAQNIEVYNGMSWLLLPSAVPTLELDSRVQTILNWASVKMNEEVRLNELAERHPSLKDALNALQHAQETVKIVAALVTK